MTICRICGSETKQHGNATILAKYVVAYFHCGACGFLQTEDPCWLDEAYHSSIAASDTGGLLRSLILSEQVSVILYCFFDRTARFLDFAGGHGLFTRRMRDIGFDFYWHDKYTPNLMAKGFEYLEETGEIELITSFESFEHFVEPLKEIETMLAISRNIIFTTELLPVPLPPPDEWYYYGLHHGQHVSFYSSQTLRFIAGKYGLHLYSVPPIHILTGKKVSSLKLKMLLRLRQAGLFLYIKKKMSSRTVSDSIQLINRRDVA